MGKKFAVFIIALLLPTSAFALSVTYDNSAEFGGSINSQSFTVGTNANTVLIAAEFFSNAACPIGSVSAMKYGGVAMSFQGASANVGSPTRNVLYWTLANPPTGSNSFTLTDSCFSEANGAAASYYNVGSVNATTTNGNTTGTTATTNTVVAKANSMVVHISLKATSNVISAGSNVTQRSTAAFGGALVGDSNGPESTGTFSQTSTWSVNTVWIAVGLALDPFIAPPVYVPSTLICVDDSCYYQ